MAGVSRKGREGGREGAKGGLRSRICEGEEGRTGEGRRGGRKRGREGGLTLDNNEVTLREGSEQVPGRAGGTDGVVPREGEMSEWKRGWKGRRVGGREGRRTGLGR